MAYKLRHECERCGHQWQAWDKVAKRDAELAELHDDFLERERELRADLNRLDHAWFKKYQALELETHRLYAQLCEFWLAQAEARAVPEVEFVAEEENPFA